MALPWSIVAIDAPERVPEVLPARHPVERHGVEGELRPVADQRHVQAPPFREGGWLELGGLAVLANVDVVPGQCADDVGDLGGVVELRHQVDSLELVYVREPIAADLLADRAGGIQRRRQQIEPPHAASDLDRLLGRSAVGLGPGRIPVSLAEAPAPGRPCAIRRPMRSSLSPSGRESQPQLEVRLRPPRVRAGAASGRASASAWKQGPAHPARSAERSPRSEAPPPREGRPTSFAFAHAASPSSAHSASWYEDASSPAPARSGRCASSRPMVTRSGARSMATWRAAPTAASYRSYTARARISSRRSGSTRPHSEPAGPRCSGGPGARRPRLVGRPRPPRSSRHPQMGLGALAAGDALVGDVPHERVLEDELRLLRASLESRREMTRSRDSSARSRSTTRCAAPSRNRATGAGQKMRPTTAAAWRARFSSGPSRSMRAASTACTVSGISTSATSGVGAPADPLVRGAPRRSGGGGSPPRRTGLPPARSTIRSWSAAGSPPR